MFFRMSPLFSIAHTEWTNSTKAHNTLLIDGNGQPKNSMYARAHVTDFDEEKKSVTIDLSDAYGGIHAVRKINLTENGALITDTVDSDTPTEITFPLHTLSEPTVGSDGYVSVCRGGKTLLINPSLEDDMSLECISDEFDIPLNSGVEPQNHVTMPKQYHIYYKSERKCHHKICVSLEIKK